MVEHTKELLGGIMFGSGIFIFLSMIHVHNPLPVAILGGASWAYYGLKNKENAQ